MKTLTIHILKPRNPLVVACRQRHAGAHRRCGGGLRQQQQRSLRQDMRELHPQHRSP